MLPGTLISGKLPLSLYSLRFSDASATIHWSRGDKVARKSCVKPVGSCTIMLIAKARKAVRLLSFMLLPTPTADQLV